MPGKANNIMLCHALTHTEADILRTALSYVLLTPYKEEIPMTTYEGNSMKVLRKDLEILMDQLKCGDSQYGTKYPPSERVGEFYGSAYERKK